MPAEPRMTIARIVGARSHAASSWSEPITLMSCMARGDMPGPGCRTILLWTTVSGAALSISGPMAGSRMSASWVETHDRLDLGIALEPRGEERPKIAPDTGDEDPATGHYEVRRPPEAERLPEPEAGRLEPEPEAGRPPLADRFAPPPPDR